MEEITCLICGMKINNKNYNLNNNAFIYENTKENIIYCPFCGAEIRYLKNGGEIYEVNEKELDEKTLKVLDKAVKLEIFNGDFYKEASKLAKNQQVKEKFLDLSKIEYMHARVHKNLAGFKCFPNLNKLDYRKYNTDEALLKVAKKREEHAVAFYNKNYNVVCSDTIKKVFKALIGVEKEHIVLTKVD